MKKTSKKKKNKKMGRIVVIEMALLAIAMIVVICMLCIKGDVGQSNHDEEAHDIPVQQQEITTGHDIISKLTGCKNFRIDATAGTKMSYESTNEAVATVGKHNGVVKVKGPGTAIIKVKAEGTALYEEASKDITLNVYDSTPVKAGGAKAYIIGSLNSDNCKIVKQVVGEGSIHVPQGLAYTGDKYIIAYGMSGSQRIKSFDVNGDGTSVSVPKVALGHPNGFTYCDKTGYCYCVKGYTSRVVKYQPETGAYQVSSLPMGCSGIAYDRDKELFYLVSRTGFGVYDTDWNRVRGVGVCKHIRYNHTQDAGGHAGILMRCLSEGDKHGTNYVDLYDMTEGTYLGSFGCDLSEVESAAVDDDGYMLLLCNNSSKTDYIWKTPVNIEDIAAGLY